MTTTRRWVAMGALGASLALTAAAVAVDEPAASFAKPGDPPGPQMGEDAFALKLRAYNEEVALKLVNSAEVALHDFVGIAPTHPRKAVVLHFSSASHSRSTKDMAMLQKMYRRYADDGLLVLDVNVDADNSDGVFAMIEKERVGFPVLRDRFGIVARRYGLRHLPTVYVIDGDGKVTSVREGYSDDISEVLEAEVKELLRR